MPLADALEVYSKALYGPIRRHVRRPFQFAADFVREQLEVLSRGPTEMETATAAVTAGTVAARTAGGMGDNNHGAGIVMAALGFKDGPIAAIATAAQGGSIAPTTPPITTPGVQFTGAGAQVTATTGFAAPAGGGLTVTGSGVGGGTMSGLGSGHGIGMGMLDRTILSSQPSLINFFTSHYFLLLFFMSIVANRINAIVAPRNPHRLKLSIRFGLKIPAFYLLTKSVMVSSNLVLQHYDLVSKTGLVPGRAYNVASALWLSFVAMGCSGMVDSFIANLQNAATSEQAINMLEFAIMYHFAPQGLDILLIALINTCQLLTLQVMSLFPNGKDWRLVATTFWAMIDLAHFSWAVYSRSTTYPSLQLLTRLPEVVVLFLIAISVVLHGLTFAVTGGNVRRPMFEPTAMPTMDDEYGVAIFKLGKACIEATRGYGFRNEVDVIVVPFGTILDNSKLKEDMPPSSATAAGPPTAADFIQAFGNGGAGATAGVQPTTPSPYRFTWRVRTTGFGREMPDVVETHHERNRPTWRVGQMHQIRLFAQSLLSLIRESWVFMYRTIVPAQFRSSNISRQDRVAQAMASIAGTASMSESSSTSAHIMTLEEYLRFHQSQLTAAMAASAEVEAETNDRFLTLQGLRGSLGINSKGRDLWSREYPDEDDLMDDDFLPEDIEDCEGDMDSGSESIDDEEESEAESEVEEQEVWASLHDRDISEVTMTEDYDSDSLDEKTEFSAYGLKQQIPFGYGDELVDDFDLDEEVIDDGDDNDDDEEAFMSLTTPWNTALSSIQEFFLDTSFMRISLMAHLQTLPLTRLKYRQIVDGSAPLSNTSAEPSASLSSSAIASTAERESQTWRGTPNAGAAKTPVDKERRALAEILNEYRRTSAKVSTSSSSSPPASKTSDSYGMLPSIPPMATSEVPQAASFNTAGADQPSTFDDGSSNLAGRMLCVVCQSEPRNILLRPCRCLSLCNDCRSLLATRRFKQCPCCRANVEGYSKVFLP